MPKDKVWIPDLPRVVIVQMAELIKPVVDFPGKGKCYIQPVDLFSVAYTWQPVPTTQATDLKPLCNITTYHRWAFYGFFKPSIAEVLAQIPDDCLEKVVAFEIIKSPETSDDLNKELEALNAGYHVATTQLYVRQ